MNAGKQELITAELQRAEEAFVMLKIALAELFWNSAAGELYYTYYHLIQELFVEHEIQAYTHADSLFFHCTLSKMVKWTKNGGNCWQHFLDTGSRQIMAITSVRNRRSAAFDGGRRI